MSRGVLLSLLVILSASTFAQDRFAGKRQYPQTRSLSGLSGGGFAVRQDGHAGIEGALALSTPIGHTLGRNEAVLIGGTTSRDGSLRWFDGDVAVNGSNGTAALIFGTDFGLGISLVQTSRLSEDRVVNLQYSPYHSGRLGTSIGVQDLLDETVTTPDYQESAQTLFMAATYDAGSQVYVTSGVGTKRFKRGFAAVSAPLVRGTRCVVENDGYGWNYGVKLELLELTQVRSPMKVALFVGSSQGRYSTWSLALQF